MGWEAEVPAFLHSAYGATVDMRMVLGSPGGAIMAAALGAPVLTGWGRHLLSVPGLCKRVRIGSWDASQVPSCRVRGLP